MKSISFFLLNLPLVLAVPLSSRTDYAIKSSHIAPREWTKLSRADLDHLISLRIGLKQNQFDELERHLYEVSDPNHSRYGQHLSLEDVQGLSAPTEHSCDSVHEWLEGHGITRDHVEYSPAKDWFKMTLPVWQVEKLLDTEYHQYGHENGKQIVRTTQYSLPKSLHNHIDVVQPTNFFGNWKLHSTDSRIADLSVPVEEASVQSSSSSAAAAAAPASCVTGSQAVSLQCLRDFYRTSNYTPQVPKKNYVGTTNYLGQVPSVVDFKAFMTTNRPDANPTYQFTTQLIANASNNQASPGVEADLDVEMVGGFAVPTNFTTYSTGGSPPFNPDQNTPTNTNEPYLTWLDYVLGQKSVPYVITTSYGDDEQTVPLDYAQRVCSELAQLGARGITLLFSSGDSGVGANGTCVSNDGTNKQQFLPAFPASCPYVTTVGGTRDFAPEQVAFDTGNGYVAGSGFSNYFARPDYQQAAVSAYLTTLGTKNQGLYNTTGRAYPDISAQSYRFLVNYMAAPTPVDGTSVASPLAAGILTLINDALIAKGKPTLGFLNPRLYSTNGAGFNDIVTGSSTGCDTAGFPAGKGWDVASGFGTPDFVNIRASLGV
ncbi:hypothetical protein M409DRAFT_69783 [Zasmidium cellare ATCC 36951]|uniref:tripeptidyl-peptidase II n=1 Tax=Zasmidium cellare ATCC 36951 TaxID=1080233 RepID=A0A6A6C2V4_ZASCE|nr:uncharacterized protein M409DRAFT_69783 [Zasmidium cellare ATCC 36951]KAF2161434.1 hypothetical protein M409DRAFT_69783 [Zasmidium cellare ATCC 36951]